MRIIILLLAFIVSTVTNGQSTLTVKGFVENGAGNSIFLEKLVNNQPVRADSATIGKDNKFKLTSPVEEMTFFRMHVKPNDFVILLADENTKEIDFTAKMSSLATTYDVKGSPHTEYTKLFLQEAMRFVRYKDSISRSIKGQQRKAQRLTQEIRDRQNSPTVNQEEVDSLSAIANAANQEARSAQMQFNSKSKEFINFRNTFIDEHPNSPSVLTTLSYINPQREFDIYKKVVNVAKTQMPGSFYDKQLSRQLAQIEQQRKQEEEKKKRQQEMAQRLAPGKEAPELEFNDPDGNPIKLSDLRGKVVLLDFWASWCGPCRRENPNVVKLYNEYKDDGFTIYSVSLDRNKQKWVGAIQSDNLVWDNHVSDLKGWSSEAARTYGVSGIPYTVLIDKEGKIIATRLRGSALEQKLSEIFGS